MVYRLFKRYMHFYHDSIYYRKVHTIGAENIPEHCPLMIVSNHQNSVCDPLALLFSIKTRRERKVRIISRADVFNKPVANRFLRWLGILPAYRLAVDGIEYLENNTDTFEAVEEELLQNGTVIMYPEGKHQDKRWLGAFSTGYLHIVFEAARKSNFEKELFVLPSCNHYSDYYNTKEDVLIKYGTPISIAPFYELYKTKPRTAQRQVNALVREQIEALMLNIQDLENYDAIDYLRNTYGCMFAEQKGLKPRHLPDKLLSDRELCAKLSKLRETNEQDLQEVYEKARILRDKTERYNINDRDFDKTYHPLKMCLIGLLFIIGIPFFILGCLPNMAIVFAPNSLTSRIKDPMLHSSIRFGIGAVVTIPILYLSMFFLMWKVITGSLLVALLYVAFLPALGSFAARYKESFRLWRSEWRFYMFLGQGKLFDLIALRSNIHQSLNYLLNRKPYTLRLQKSRFRSRSAYAD